MQSEKAKSNPPTLNGKSKINLADIVRYQLESSPLEANKVFPSEPSSAYLSSFFPDSFDFPFNPDPLARNNNYDIYDEMKHDDQVKAAISIKKDLICAPGWEIVCEDQNIVDFFESNFGESLDGNFENSIRDILSSFEYGFSLTEPTFRRLNGKVELKDLKTRPPHTFEFKLNDKGDLMEITQNQTSGPVQFKPAAFIHHVYQPEFGSPFGKSDLRSAFLPWKTKKFFFRFWGIYVERFAAPTVIGTYPADYTTPKINQLQDILRTIQNSTAITIPEGSVIDFKMANQDSSNIYQEGINHLNTMMARAILMPDLLGLSGEQTRQGSLALGQTQFQMFMQLIRKEQDALARLLTIKVIRPMVLANFGDVPCEFRFKSFSTDNTIEFSKIWIDAVKSKIWKPSVEEIDHIRETIKFPTNEVEIPEDPQPPNVPRGNLPDDVPGDDDPDNLGARRAGGFSSKGDIRIFRDLTEFEKKIDFQQIKENLSVTDARVTPRLRSAANMIWRDYMNQIRKKGILTKFKPEKINDLRPRFQKPMKIEFKRYMGDTYKQAVNQAQKEVFPDRKKLFVNEEELLPSEFLEIIDAESFKLVGDYSIDITKRMKNVLQEGIKDGIGERALLERLREIGKNETDKWLRTVVRTKTTEMFNRGRKTFFDNDPDASQLIEGFQYSAIIDDRTSEVCQFLDGNIYLKGELTTNITPPLHFNCRSLLVPVTKFEDFKSDPKFVPPSKEPSTDKLKEKGGNLILSDQNKVKKFFRDKQTLFASGQVMNFGSSIVVPSPGPERSIGIVGYDISNNAETPLLKSIAGVHSSNDEEVLFQKMMGPGDSVFREFSVNDPWILKKGDGFAINLTTDNVPIDYTVEYIILDANNNRIA